MIRPPPISTLFPYTTLFRSHRGVLTLLRLALALGISHLALSEAAFAQGHAGHAVRSEEHTSELQSQSNLVCRLLLEKKNSPRARSQHCPIYPISYGPVAQHL